jgi:hypothetical protein
MQPAATTAGALAAARLLLVLGDLPAAIDARARVQAPPTPRTRTEAAVLDTLLALATGNQDQALDHLEDALGTAAPLERVPRILTGGCGRPSACWIDTI